MTDPEILAMRTIVRTLEKLPPTARQRVVEWAVSKAGETATEGEEKRLAAVNG